MKRNMVLALAVLALGGCGPSSEKDEKAVRYVPSLENPDASNPPQVSKIKSIGKLGPDDVIVWVDGSALTRKGFEDAVNFIRFQIGKYKGNAKPQQLNSVYNTMCGRIVQDFITEQVLVHEARNRKLFNREQLDAAYAAAKADFAKACNVKEKNLARAYPGGELTLGRMLENMVWKRAMIAAIPKPEVSDATVSNLIADIRAENKALAASNELQRVKLQRLREEIVRTKADFEEMAKKHSQCPFRTEGEQGNWGAFARSDFRKDFYNEDLGKAIFALKPGEMSDVLEDGEGYSIVKFIGYDKRDEKLKEDERDRVFSRIFLPKQSFYLIESFKVTKEGLTRQVQGEAVEKEVNRLKGLMKIVYPHGDDFFGEKMREAKRAAKAAKPKVKKAKDRAAAQPSKNGETQKKAGQK